MVFTGVLGPTVADYAAGLLYQSIKKSHTLNLAPRQVFQQEGFQLRLKRL